MSSLWSEALSVQAEITNTNCSMEDSNQTTAVTCSFGQTNVTTNQANEVVTILSITGSLIGILAIVLNGIFLICMRLLKDRTVPYYTLMQNMSLADILSSLFFLLTQNWPEGPFATIDSSKSLVLVHGLPYVFRSMPWMFFTVYLLTLTTMTFTHYVAVCRPWKYTEVSERGLIRKTLLIVWLLSSLQIFAPITVLILLSMMKDKQKAMTILMRVSTVEIQVWMVIFAVCTLINIVLDLIVYRKIKQLRLKQRQHSYFSPATRNIRNKQDAFVTVSLLIIFTVICRLPLPLLGIVGFNLAQIISINKYYIINVVAVILLYTNFLTDPVIYITRTKDIHKSLHMLSCCVPHLQEDNGPKPVTSTLRLHLLEGQHEQNQQEGVISHRAVVEKVILQNCDNVTENSIV